MPDRNVCNGTKIEKLPEGTTIVRWPQGGGVVRYSDGSGAAFHPDPQDPSRSSDLSDLEGTVEVLPGGVIRQTLKDGKTSFGKYPDGTIRSPADFGKPEAGPMQSSSQSMGKDISTLPVNLFKENKNSEQARVGAHDQADDHQVGHRTSKIEFSVEKKGRMKMRPWVIFD